MCRFTMGFVSHAPPVKTGGATLTSRESVTIKNALQKIDSCDLGVVCERADRIGVDEKI